MNKNNIFQVISESQISEILQNNAEMLTVVIFSASNNCIVPTETNVHLKKKIKREISIKYKNVIYLYVDLNKYHQNPDERKYTQLINRETVPLSLFIWRNEEVGNIKGVSAEDIDNVIPKIFANIQNFIEVVPRAQPDALLHDNIPKKEDMYKQQCDQIQCNQVVNVPSSASHSDNNYQLSNQQINSQTNYNQSINNQSANNQLINNQSVPNQYINNESINNPQDNTLSNYNQATNMPNSNQLVNTDLLIGEQLNIETNPQMNIVSSNMGDIIIDQNQLLIDIQKTQDQINYQEKMKKIDELRKMYAVKEVDKFIQSKEKKEMDDSKTKKATK